MADAILEQQSGDSTSIDFTIFTVDVNPQTQQVARQMVELAGLSDHVSFVLLPTPTGTSMPDASTNDNQRLSDQLHRAMRERFGGDDQQQPPHPIDFLFVDHAKELYLPDVQQLERGGFLRAGSAVAADNVVFFRLDEYRRYMQQQQAQGVVDTHLVSDNIWLEYHSPEAVVARAPARQRSQPGGSARSGHCRAEGWNRIHSLPERSRCGLGVGNRLMHLLDSTFFL